MIYGKRIRLRANDRKDLPLFVEWLNDPDVRENLLVRCPLSMAAEEKWFESMLEKPEKERPLGIEARVGKGWKLIGNTGLFGFHEIDHNAEIGIMIGDKSCWDKGYGCEAMQLMVHHGFYDLGLHRIYLHVYETNLRGIRCYEKAGFIKEGVLRQDIWSHGRHLDVVVMSVLRTEWQDPFIKER
jgi:RimJ/RimL family protein N-acetyltransferase